MNLNKLKINLEIESLKIIKKDHLDIFLYESDLFEMRLKEEKIRADVFKSDFVIMEILWDKLFQVDTQDHEISKVLRQLFYTITHSSRGSDIKGFAEKQSGLLVLLLDSNLTAAHRMVRRISEKFRTEGLNQYIHEKAFTQTFDCAFYSGEHQQFQIVDMNIPSFNI